MNTTTHAVVLGLIASELSRRDRATRVLQWVIGLGAAGLFGLAVGVFLAAKG